jgi:hypothetical protein
LDLDEAQDVVLALVLDVELDVCTNRFLHEHGIN